MINNILYAINNCFNVFLAIIIIRCFLTWIPGVNWNNPIIKSLASAVDLYLNLFKKFIPPMGMIDLSPMVAGIVLIVIQKVTLYLLILLFAGLGLIG